MSNMTQTAEEFLREYQEKNKYFFSQDDCCEIIDLMKQYAKQVAKKALMDAADNLSQAPGTFNSDYSSQKVSILNTEIQTP